MTGVAEARIVIARGALAAESFLLGELRALSDAARADWSLLARPVRVVVPSRSLRDHLAARLVKELGGAAAGIAIQTLRALAYELLERAGLAARGGQTLLPVLVRRFAAQEPALAAALSGFDDGFSIALATVNDLLDAGLDASNAESALDCLAEAGASASPAVAARAEALLRVAERVRAELERLGLEPRAGFFRRAREALERAPGLLPTRALFLHGWADVTGVQLDLVETLVRAQGGRVVLDHPADPADASDAGPGPRWTERLRVRLGGPECALPAASAEPSLTGVEAPGTHAEARAVAVAIRVLLDEGAAPESIGIVLREPAPYRHALHAQLGRLGIPFSGNAGSLGPLGRRAAAVLELLERREACPADRWLDAERRSRHEQSADLRLAFHGIGVGRLGDVASLDLAALLGEERAYPLRVRRGIRTAPAEASDEGEADNGAEPEREASPGVRVVRRTVSRRALERASAAASKALEKIAQLRAETRLAPQLAALRALLHGLGWRPRADDADTGELYGALAALEAELGGSTALSADELLVVLRRLFAELGREPLGGRGGGVALLSAVEARGRSFARLFVMGMNRDVFPRLVREDPLLPDALRRALEAVLPDVPVKQRAEDEERYLFAALCGAAPAVTLSWLATSDDGKERPASPLIEALRVRLAPPLAPTLLGDVSGPRPAFEHALRAGIARERGRAREALALALGSEPLAHARAEAAEKLDVGGWAERLGPFFGFVGAAGPGDPRASELAVTRLEGMAYCAWQTFLERVLRLEPPPDALAELPDATPLLVGNVVHAVLEALVAEAGGAVSVTLEEALARGPVRIVWPEPARLAALAQQAAAAAARAEGIVQLGFARLVVQRAQPILERIRALDFASGSRDVLGAELRGSLELARAGGGVRRLSFRADRADPVDGGVALVDYKTGAPVHATAKGEDTRRSHLLRQIAKGRRLQGPAYALSGEPVREGRYLFAKPELADANARVAITRDDAEARAAFEGAAADLLAAFELGAFPPRLLGGKRAGSARACASCDVAEACLQGETGSRRHLAAWLGRHEAAPARLPAAARAAHALLVRTEDA